MCLGSSPPKEREVTRLKLDSGASSLMRGSLSERWPAGLLCERN